jgi:hypothetical protein
MAFGAMRPSLAIAAKQGSASRFRFFEGFVPGDFIKKIEDVEAFEHDFHMIFVVAGDDADLGPTSS